jgi:hypothetical protein
LTGNAVLSEQVSHQAIDLDFSTEGPFTKCGRVRGAITSTMASNMPQMLFLADSSTVLQRELKYLLKRKSSTLELLFLMHSK